MPVAGTQETNTPTVVAWEDTAVAAWEEDMVADTAEVATVDMAEVDIKRSYSKAIVWLIDKDST